MSTPEDTSLDVGARARALLEGADWDRLARVFAGEATSRERAAIAAWVAADPSRGAAVEALRQAWLDAGTRDPRWAAWSPEAGWHALAPRLAADATPSSRGLGSASPRVWPQGAGGGVWWRRRANSAVVGARTARPQSFIAAMVVIALGIGVAISSVWRRAAVASPGRTYATAAGQRLSVTLVDGTQLTLAPASRVRVAADYGQGPAARELELDGEAYVAVVHDTAHPFAVRTHGAVAWDVGTAFDVRAYPEDAGAKIAVAEGAVAVTVAGGCPMGVRARISPVALPHLLATRENASARSEWGYAPASASTAAGKGGPCSADARAGDVATVENEGVSVKHGADIAAHTAWRQGGLAFEDTPLREVVRDIHRAFGVKITVLDSALLGRPVTATFSDQPLDLVLDEVTRVVGARYEQTATGIVVRSGIAGARSRQGAPRPPLMTARAGDSRE